MAKAKSSAKSLTKSVKKSFVKLDEEIWPLERDLFFRPGRMKYVRKLIKPKGCVFCTSAKNTENVKTLCIYKSKTSQIVLNKYPYNNGHLLVLPLRHVGDILSLSQAEYLDLHQTLKLAVQAIKDVYSPHGLNIGMNHGATGGAGIPDHLHYHIVPRWNSDLNFFPLIAETKLIIETVETSYKNFTNYFTKVINMTNNSHVQKKPSQKRSRK